MVLSTESQWHRASILLECLRRKEETIGREAQELFVDVCRLRILLYCSRHLLPHR